mmetsp:Transcript_109532/g.163752  ORF Transcript_109532/g.163752 Transcript_109532/m.163752 type:complete len:301 (+) Transcript_109532:220-1122(+)
MYRGIMSSSAKTAEQELNKPYIAPDEKEDLTTPSLLQRKPVSATQDDWNKVMEDPLLNIKQQEQDAIKMIAKNPVKMREIMRKLKEQESKKKRKSKSHKKRKKHSRRSYSPSISPPRKKQKRDSPSRTEEYRGRYISRSPRSRRYSPERHSSTRSGRDHRSRHNRDRYYEQERSRSPRRRRRSPSVSPRRNYEERNPRNAVRPSRQRREKTSLTSTMSEEERLARIQEMEDAGKANYDMKLKRYLKSKEEKKREDAEIVTRDEDNNFITKMKDGVYLDKDATIEERLGRHKHYLKREQMD